MLAGGGFRKANWRNPLLFDEPDEDATS